jgi:hypothetical protein
MSGLLTADQIAYLRELAAEQRRKWLALDVKDSIIKELFTAIRRCDGSPELLSIIGSYGDTLDDKEVLQLLKDWNETGKILHQSQ